MAKELSIEISLARYSELILAERNAQLMAAFLQKKKDAYEPITYDELKLVCDMFTKQEVTEV